MITPGPWKIRLRQHENVNGRESAVWAISSAEGQDLAYTTRLRPFAETQSNARLIAAAPILLQAFRAMDAIRRARTTSEKAAGMSALVQAHAAIAELTEAGDET